MKYEVYVYFDPRIPYDIIIEDKLYKVKPIYVGKGNIKQNRKYKHTKITKYNKKNKLVQLIKQLNENSFEPIIVSVFKTNSERLAFKKEIELIQTIGRENMKKGPLLNLTDGGEGHSGIKYSKDELLRRSIQMKEFWKKLTPDERKEMGRLSAANRTFQGKLRGSIKQKNTKRNFSDEKKQEIEKRRFDKWKESYSNRDDKQKEITSKKCSKASYKKSMYFIQYKENNIIKNNWLIDMINYGYARDGIMYRITGKVEFSKPFKSRTTGNKVQILSFEKRNDYLLSNS